jgi:hypothetical protein
VHSNLLWLVVENLPRTVAVVHGLADGVDRATEGPVAVARILVRGHIDDAGAVYVDAAHGVSIPARRFWAVEGPGTHEGSQAQWLGLDLGKVYLGAPWPAPRSA